MVAIIDAVPYGHDNAVTREELSRRTGLSNRALRDGINKGEELIINLQDGKGYFRPLPEEAYLVEGWIRLMRSRIREENKRISIARRWANGL